MSYFAPITLNVIILLTESHGILSVGCLPKTVGLNDFIKSCVATNEIVYLDEEMFRVAMDAHLA